MKSLNSRKLTKASKSAENVDLAKLRRALGNQFIGVTVYPPEPDPVDLPSFRDVSSRWGTYAANWRPEKDLTPE